MAFIDDGLIVERGKPTEVPDAPKNQRTKRFIGLVLEH